MKKVFRYIMFAGMFISHVLLISLGMTLFNINLFNLNKKAPEIKVSEDCNKTTVVLTAECLNRDFNSWWKYNISNVDLFFSKTYGVSGSIVNWDIIKKQGGVCWHAAKWYYDYIKSNTNFDATYVTIPAGNESHRITIISNRQAYCLLDQWFIRCFEFGGDKNET